MESNPLERVLHDIQEETDMGTLKARYAMASKMLFALFESIEEHCSDSLQKDIYQTFESLTGEKYWEE